MTKVGLKVIDHDTRRTQKAGLTLIEVVVAMTILVMVIAGSYTMVSQAVRLNDAARKHYLATTIAGSRLERAQTFSYGNLHLLHEENMVVNDHGVPSPGGDFRRSTVINTNYGVMKTAIDVTVDIRDGKSGAFEGEVESVSSIFTEYIQPPVGE